MQEYNLKDIQKLLLDEQPFDFKVKKAEFFGKGQYCFVFLINDEYIFKFPRYFDVNKALQKETRILQALQGKTSLPIPKIKYVGVTEGMQYLGYEIIRGEFLNISIFNALSEIEKDNVITQLTEFFNEMHSVKMEKFPQGLIEVKEFKNPTKEFFLGNYNAKLAKLFDKAEDEFIRNSFESYLANEDNFNFEPILTHGDLHFENLIYDNISKRIIGVIDFGDACFADNVYDFRYADLLLGRDITLKILTHYKHKICGKWPDKIEIFNLCNYIFDAIWSMDHKNQKGVDFAVKKLKETISQYKKWRGNI